MARPSKSDPIRNFKFQVQINPSGALKTAVGDTILTMGFAVVSGISVTNDMISYREGGMNTHPHKLIGQSDYAPVTFSKGVFAHEDDLYQWTQFLHSWNQGGAGNTQGGTSEDNDYRCDITVSVFDHPISSGSYATPGQTTGSATPAGTCKLRYRLHECWPASYSLTDLNAGDSSVMVQQMVINHEGFEINWADSVTGVAAAFT